MKMVKNITKTMNRVLKKMKKWKPVHTLIAVLLVLMLGCATFCPNCCVFLPSVLNFREGFDNPHTNTRGNLGADESLRNKAVFAMFYAPWCGHCKKAKPIWESVMSKNQGLMKAIDCTTEKGKEIAKKHGVSVFPTIKWFQNGLEDTKNFIMYEGERTVKGFQDFIDKHK